MSQFKYFVHILNDLLTGHDDINCNVLELD